MSEVIVGIDLGTTNSEVAVVQDGKVVVIEDQSGNKILPSFVGIGDNGEILVGEPAKNQYALYPERTVKSIKRRMGEDVKVEMAGQSYSPQEISAIIIKRLKAVAEAYLGHPVRKAVITVPAYFSDTQRQATREAGEIAGLEVVRMINEPTAAALSYESDQKGHKRVLVYDLGGGTFDVSVVNIEHDVVEVVSSHGNNHLGGDDFDAKIVDHLLAHIQAQHGLDLKESRKAMARLVRAAERAKLELSDQPYTRIEEEYLAEKDGKPLHLSLELACHDYEEMIQGYLDETLEAVHIALKDANLTASDIDKILLVGGSTRTPAVRQRLHDEFGVEAHSEVHPDLCVATGAAIQAAMIGGAKVSTVLVDVTPYTYGTDAVGELDGEITPFMYVPIIRKNSPLPVSKSDVFYTMHDGQKVVDVKIYQGEDPDSLNNILIGQFRVEGLQDVPSGNPIVISLDLDLNGILHVSAKEKATGLENRITIENAILRFEDQQLDQARERIAAIFGETLADETAPEIDSATQEHHEIAKARALVEKAERMLEQASSEDREDMVNLIEAIREAMAAEDFAALSEAVEALSDILYYLET
jgi:molecular chaperone DnaK